MTLSYSAQPSFEIDPRRRRTAYVVGICAAVYVALALLPMAMFVVRVGSSNAYILGTWLYGAFASCIGPALLLIVAPGIARGRGGAVATAVVISSVLIAQLLFSGAWFLFEIGPRPAGVHLIWTALRIAVALTMTIFAVRQWWEERSLEPDALRIQAARSAWFRGRVALVIAWALLFGLAALTLALGAIFYAEDPKGMGGGIGMIFMVFGGVVAAIGVWLLVLWIRLRRRGPIVARSTAWQVTSMLLVWTLLSAFGASNMGASGSIFNVFPTAMLAWILIELLHASLARNADRLSSAFEVIPLGGEIPVANAIQPPPLPRSMFEPMEGREHV